LEIKNLRVLVERTKRVPAGQETGGRNGRGGRPHAEVVEESFA